MKTLEVVGTSLVLKTDVPAPWLKDLGGKWTGKVWTFPATTLNAWTLKESTPDLELVGGAKDLVEGWGFKHQELDLDAIREWSPEYADKLASLFPYQRTAVEFLLSSPHGGSLLRIFPGGGKTAVASLAAVLSLTQDAKVLVVAPLTLLRTWEREFLKWTGHVGWLERRHGQDPGTGWTLTNYDTVVRRPAYQNVKWDLVILDESVLVKNRMTKRFKALQAIRKRGAKFWLLSGSPTTRFADDLFTQMALLEPSAFRSYWRFTNRYVYVEDGVWGKTLLGTREDRNIRRDLADLMWGVNQDEVLPDLPDFLYDTIEVELSGQQLRMYKMMEREFVLLLESGKELSASTKLSQLIRLQQVVSDVGNVDPDISLSAKIDVIEDLVNAGALDYPAIVWTHWTTGAENLAQRLSLKGTEVRIGVVNGKLKPEENEQTTEAFRQGDLDILVLSLGVGKYGLTFTNTKTIIYMDRTWDADAFFQSAFRVRRIGLTHRPRHVTLKAVGTVDELIEDNLAGKMATISKVTNEQLAKLMKGLGR